MRGSTVSVPKQKGKSEIKNLEGSIKISMLGVLVLARLEARGWGFKVAFLLSFGFFRVFFLCFLFFFCFGVLVCSLYA
jgi:hypothetical protein